jgi:threonine dehydrogenase-like Zn-dependent dehydrogenase
MRVAVLVKPGRIEMEERPIPSPAAGDVLVRVSAVGVCGSDTRYYRHGRVGGFVVDGRVDLDAMVTARFPLEMAAHALDSDHVPGTVKSVVTVS